MKAIATIILIFAVLVAHSGEIRGTVRAEGKPELAGEAAGGKYDSRKYKFVERVNYAELRNFVVYIEGPLTNSAAATNATARVDTKRVNQEKANFTPAVLPIEVGTTVEWPNNDDIFHNVFSMSDAKQFDLGLYKGNPKEKRVTFDKPGRVEVFCSIHANMHCVVLVLENPFYAVTDSEGRYVIRNVPAGTYKLKAWHERLPAQVQEITVAAEGEVKANFTLGINNLPKY
ncbi:MAG TPA: carboxypeptidase regulatory-like domain-containing protein [Verrucomicrobiae bacterium]|nr:carboxypeptidase regulatory-like domain-containing protein [Verrucomicrobiae bacterium]